MTTPQMDFDIREERAALILGVGRELLSKAREKKGRRGADWQMVTNEVRYSQDGLARILKAAGLGEDVNATDLAAECRDAEKMGAVRQCVVLRHFANPHLLEVQFQDDGSTGRVRVRKAAMCTRGMVLPVKMDPADTIWTLARKAPRWEGRW